MATDAEKRKTIAAARATVRRMEFRAEVGGVASESEHATAHTVQDVHQHAYRPAARRHARRPALRLQWAVVALVLDGHPARQIAGGATFI
jgi:hypothetical protein